MSDVSISSNDTAQGKDQPVDAQAENERDMDKGLAGAEAKPFRDSASGGTRRDDMRNDGEDDGKTSLVSGRRNPGR